MFARTVTLLAVLCCGRAEEQLVPLPAWTLEVDGAAPTLVTLPVHLDSVWSSRPSRYRLRTRVVVPPPLRGQSLVLAIGHFPALTSLRANGIVVPPVDDESWNRYRSSGSLRWSLSPEKTQTGVVELELAVEHRWSGSAWIDSLPRLSATVAGDRRFLVERAVNLGGAWLTLSAIVILFPFNLLVFLRDRRRRAHGWLAAMILICVGYPIFLLGFSQVLLGRYDTVIGFALIPFGAAMSVHSLHSHLRLPPPSRGWMAMALALAALPIVGGSFTGERWLAIGTLGSLVVNLAYQWILIARSRGTTSPARKGRVILGSWGGLLAFGVWDCLAWAGWGLPWGGVHLACFGLLLLFGIQSVALSYDHASSIARANALNVDLADRVREIEKLNQELRRQIGIRSQQLAQVLARLGRSTGLEATPVVGSVVGERYRVDELLGSGGMGAVYRVERVDDGRTFALKVMRGNGDAEMLSRLAQEAEIASRLHHPNVISIVDMDVTAGGHLYLVMELVRGSTLEAERGRFGDVEWGLRILSQVARALEAIHREGIVHRDLKPSNILVSGGDRPQVKVSDFGISSLRSGPSVPSLARVAIEVGDTMQAVPEEQRLLTRDGAILGTPLFMAPELVNGARNATFAADLFSFGTLAYEILSGRPPFDRPVILDRAEGREPPPPQPMSARCPSIPPSLAALIDRCLAMDQSRRPSAAELAAELEPWRG